MFSAYVAVGLLTAAANGTAATLDVLRPAWLIENMTRVGVPHRALFPLAVLKIAGALGLVIGIGVPALGIGAAAGLVLFFFGAIAAHIHAGDYASIPFPGMFLVLAIASLVLRVGSS
jgi:hypothetical protein